MICKRCKKVYRDFTGNYGVCIPCRDKAIGNTTEIITEQNDSKPLFSHEHSLENSTKHSMTIGITPRVGFDNVREHMGICSELNTLYEKKNNDYGDSFSSTFKEFGFTMSAIRLQDKLERFKRLSKGNKANVEDESIRDTLIDLANYAIMTVMEIDKNGKK